MIRYFIGDAYNGVAKLAALKIEADLIFTSPPFFSLRSYLDPDDPFKDREIGQEGTPGEYLDALLNLIDRFPMVLTEKGSVCIELGDTYYGSGGAGGDYRVGESRGKQQKYKGPSQRRPKGCTEPEPMVKSLMGIPELVRLSMIYGFNPLTRVPHLKWRVRNVVRWCRPNPQVGQLVDKWRPATSEMLVATRASDRYWNEDEDETKPPLLDWWKIPAYSYRGQHYATMNPDFVMPAVEAMTPHGGLVLDPFAGSGTTLAVAHGMGREAIGIDLDPKNGDVVKERCGMFVEVEDWR